MFCVTRDITERKRAEERLREYERLVEGLEEMIVVVDRDYRYLLANRAYLNFRGLEREQLIGQPVADVLGREAFATVADKFAECMAGDTVQYETRYTFNDGRKRDVLVSYYPIEGPGGVDRIACVLHDITERKRTEQELRRSEEKFKTLFGIAPVGIAFLDSEMNIVDCNPALERMSGLSRKDLLGTAWRQRTFVNADHSPRLGRERVTERGVLQNAHVSGVETGAVMENGDIVWAEVSVAPLALPDASAVVIMHDITERKQAHEQLRVLSRRLFQVQEEERRHLARELHDEIGQALTAVKINLTPGRTGKAGSSSARLEEAIALLDNLIRQVRQISLDLHPSLLDDLGLAPALRSLLEKQTRRAGLRAQFSAADPLEEIGREIQTTAFRIAQEAITNVLRHAGAEFVALFVVTDEKQLRMKIIDDGSGFDVAKMSASTTKRPTFGLTGMKERAALLGGQVTITSSPGQGTTVEVLLPIRENGSA
jgi:PAS domain S-box-containing protein